MAEEERDILRNARDVWCIGIFLFFVAPFFLIMGSVAYVTDNRINGLVTLVIFTAFSVTAVLFVAYTELMVDVKDVRLEKDGLAITRRSGRAELVPWWRIKMLRIGNLGGNIYFRGELIPHFVTTEIAEAVTKAYGANCGAELPITKDQIRSEAGEHWIALTTAMIVAWIWPITIALRIADLSWTVTILLDVGIVVLFILICTAIIAHYTAKEANTEGSSVVLSYRSGRRESIPFNDILSISIRPHWYTTSGRIYRRGRVSPYMIKRKAALKLKESFRLIDTDDQDS